MSIVVSQQQTDLVSVEDLPGGVSLLTFAWESRDPEDAPGTMWARTSDVATALATAEKAGTPPVTALADHRAVPRWVMLRQDPNVPDILDSQPLEVIERASWRQRGGLPSVFVSAAEGGADVDPAHLYRRDLGDGTLISFVDDAPVARPVRIEGPSARDFDLAQAADALVEHPWVLRVAYDQGRPGDYDHVPASLVLDVLVPQDALDTVVRERGYASPYALGEALVLASVIGRGPLGVDPLGLARAKRSTPYVEPTEEWEIGEAYPALHASLPSGRDEW